MGTLIVRMFSPLRFPLIEESLELKASLRNLQRLETGLPASLAEAKEQLVRQMVECPSTCGGRFSPPKPKLLNAGQDLRSTLEAALPPVS